MNKFRAKKAKYNVADKTYFFDSIAEKKEFVLLHEKLKNKEIKALFLQPDFVLQKSEKVNCSHTQKKFCVVSKIGYTADFKVVELDGSVTIIEVKGVATEAFNIRKRIFIKQCKGGVIKGVDRYRIIFKNKIEEYVFG